VHGRWGRRNGRYIANYPYDVPGAFEPWRSQRCSRSLRSLIPRRPRRGVQPPCWARHASYVGKSAGSGAALPLERDATGRRRPTPGPDEADIPKSSAPETVIYRRGRTLSPTRVDQRILERTRLQPAAPFGSADANGYTVLLLEDQRPARRSPKTTARIAVSGRCDLESRVRGRSTASRATSCAWTPPSGVTAGIAVDPKPRARTYKSPTSPTTTIATTWKTSSGYKEIAPGVHVPPRSKAGRGEFKTGRRFRERRDERRLARAGSEGRNGRSPRRPGADRVRHPDAAVRIPTAR